MLQGKYEDAVKECTKAVELNPSYLKALIRRAEAHEKLEHFEEAITGIYGTLNIYCYILGKCSTFIDSFSLVETSLSSHVYGFVVLY